MINRHLSHPGYRFSRRIFLGATATAPLLRSKAGRADVLPADALALLQMCAILPFAKQGTGQRTIAVIYAPWCPVCQRLAYLAAETRGVEWRWLGTDPRTPAEAEGIRAVASSGDGRFVIENFRGRPHAAASIDPIVWELTQSCLAYVTHEAETVAVADGIEQFGFPIYLYSDMHGSPRIAAGFPTDPNGFLASVGPGIQMTDGLSRLAGSHMETIAIVGELRAHMPMLAAPLVKAPPVATLAAASRVEFVKRLVTPLGTRWLGALFLRTEKGSRAYCWVPEAAVIMA